MNLIEDIRRRDFNSFINLWEHSSIHSKMDIVTEISKYGLLNNIKWIYYYHIHFYKDFDSLSIYTTKIINEASLYDNIHIIEWMNSFGIFEYNHNAADNASMSGNINVLNLLLSYEREGVRSFMYSYMAIVRAIIGDHIQVLIWFYVNHKFYFPEEEMDIIVIVSLMGKYDCLRWICDYFPHKIQNNICLKYIINKDTSKDIYECLNILILLIDRGYTIPDDNISEYFEDKYLDIILFFRDNGCNIRNNITKESDNIWLSKHNL
jgi:hypothetical protein